MDNVKADRFPTKLIISNLHLAITDSDIHELFGMFGPLVSAAVRCDLFGRSFGTAHATFQRCTDAVRAMKNYNGVRLYGLEINIKVTSEIPSLVGTVYDEKSQNMKERRRKIRRKKK
ncbi:hypothetical protein NQ314_004952 [Rhamnusium bicolor]|uniref:RRM domain-containing protein n=1 Tax=Rhamnusium bicolor TaxID=1586634 RepID=A0AAV8ZLC1_9CUCU|nr:hypothetical protein NQ314_004952 [Rhamnusium bicolor]